MIRSLLYLHGLDSQPLHLKVRALEAFGAVTAPQLDYRRPGFYEQQLAPLAPLQFDAYVGSSMGGWLALQLALAAQVPALLFNPALVQRSHEPDLEGIPAADPQAQRAPLYVLFGEQDDVIPWTSSHQKLVEEVDQEQLHVRRLPGLGHRIPPRIFEEAVAWFMESAFGERPTGARLPSDDPA